MTSQVSYRHVILAINVVMVIFAFRTVIFAIGEIFYSFQIQSYFKKLKYQQNYDHGRVDCIFFMRMLKSSRDMES